MREPTKKDYLVGMRIAVIGGFLLAFLIDPRPTMHESEDTIIEALPNDGVGWDMRRTVDDLNFVIDL